MQQIVDDILSYLIEHPDAQDTLEGIVEWWLSRRAVKPNTALVVKALTELVNRRLIITRSGRDARTYYKLNRRKLKELPAILARHRSGDAPED